MTWNSMKHLKITLRQCHCMIFHTFIPSMSDHRLLAERVPLLHCLDTVQTGRRSWLAGGWGGEVAGKGNGTGPMKKVGSLGMTALFSGSSGGEGSCAGVSQ